MENTVLTRRISMKKRSIVLVFTALVLLFSLTGCGLAFFAGDYSGGAEHTFADTNKDFVSDNCTGELKKDGTFTFSGTATTTSGGQTVTVAGSLTVAPAPDFTVSGTITEVINGTPQSYNDVTGIFAVGTLTAEYDNANGELLMMWDKLQ